MRGDEHTHAGPGLAFDDEERLPGDDFGTDDDLHSSDDDEGGSIREVIVTICAAIALALVLQQFFVKPFRIPSGSMENTLHCGDRVLVDRLSYRFTDPKRFDVVVFHPPAGIGEGGTADPSVVAGEGGLPRKDKSGTRDVTRSDYNYIKRIIGMPGDTIELKKHHAYVDGKRLDEPYLHPLRDVNGFDSGGDFPKATVPKDTYLMLGDHRDNSADGRVFGWVPRSFIVGRALVVYWPPKRFGGLPQRDAGGPSKIDPACLESGIAPEQRTGGDDG